MSTAGPAHGGGPVTLELVTVGTGAGARAVVEAVSRAAALRVVGVVARPASGTPRPGRLPAAAEALAERTGARLHASLDDALAVHEDACFVVALPPRAAREAAQRLEAAGRRGVVFAPVGDDATSHEHPQRAASPPPSPGRPLVRVVDVGCSLQGVELARRALARPGAPAGSLELRGAPGAAAGDVVEVLQQALSIARRILPGASVARALAPDDATIEVALVQPRSGRRLLVRAQSHGSALTFSCGAAHDLVRWRYEAGEEHAEWEAGGTHRTRTHPVPSLAERALRAMAADAPLDTLADAEAVRSLTRTALAALPSRPPPGRARLASAAALLTSDPPRLLDAFGLRGRLPDAPPTPIPIVRVATPTVPLELASLRSGVKRVAFLTTRPEALDTVLSACAGLHVERRERRVHVGTQDTWDDRRDRGEPRVELYVSAEATLATRAAHLQAERDPTAALLEMGELLGYPRCCSDAFARQRDRANNSGNRYASAARTPPGAPWRWTLNNLFTNLVPFYPCRYDCAPAAEYGARTLAAVRTEQPALADALADALPRDVLYFDHEHQLVLGPPHEDGTRRAGAHAFGSVAAAEQASPSFAAFGGAVARGDSLTLGEDALTVFRGDDVVLRFDRTDPALGFLAPFGGTTP